MSTPDLTAGWSLGLPPWGGMPVITDSSLTVPNPNPEARFPRALRSKKRRVRRKWLRRYPAGVVPDRNVYRVGGMLLAHPMMVRYIEEVLR